MCAERKEEVEQLQARIQQLELDASANEAIAADLRSLQRRFEQKDNECQEHILARTNLEEVLQHFQAEEQGLLLSMFCVAAHKWTQRESNRPTAKFRTCATRWPRVERFACQCASPSI